MKEGGKYYTAKHTCTWNTTNYASLCYASTYLKLGNISSPPRSSLLAHPHIQFINSNQGTYTHSPIGFSS
nr:hypothetical protein Q903MT_gene4973 [Picea sitchensis]